MINYFLPGQNQEVKDYYEANGYVVIKNAVSDSKIDEFLKTYEDFKCSSNYYFRSQDTNQSEKLAINNEGFIERSILNPTGLVFQKKYCTAVENIIYSPEISKLLTVLSKCQKHTVWQTMFFDKSTGTVAHQDHYYLDSDPPGNLVACWFALEDIHEQAGAFFVVPKSHKGPLITREPNTSHTDGNQQYVRKMQYLIEQQNYRPQPMLLEKGSVLFWHPFLVHGAFENINPSHSRKSFTAHYLPDAYNQLRRKTVTPKVSSFNPEILVWEKSILESAKEYARYFKSWAEVKFRDKDKKPKMDMRSSKYLPFK